MDKVLPDWNSTGMPGWKPVSDLVSSMMLEVIWGLIVRLCLTIVVNEMIWLEQGVTAENAWCRMNRDGRAWSSDDFRMFHAGRFILFETPQI